MESNKKKKPPQGADRVPPQALDVERTILGSMLIDKTAVDIALEHLAEDCFYSEAHTKIFTCIRELAIGNSPVDLITVAEKLRQKKWLEDAGAESYLAELCGSVTTPGNMEYYSSIIRGKATLRHLISATAQIATECFADEREPQEVLDMAENRIFGIAESRIKNKVVSMEQAAPQLLEEIINGQDKGISGVPTGFTKLDQMTTGLQGGDLIIVGGRPSMGKTAFCLSVALHAAVQAKCPTVIFSLEMSTKQIFHRMVSAEARIDLHLLRSGKLSKSDYPKLTAATETLKKSPLFVDETAGITILELRAKARRLKAQHNLGLLIVDYLQLMTPSVRMENVQQEISQISRSLKSIAKELDMPVIALSQLNRVVEQRSGDHRPRLSDLRESGAIEQDADVVMFVYRDSMYNRDDPVSEGKAEIIVGKQRNGPTGTVELAFVRDFARFENLAEQTGKGK